MRTITRGDYGQRQETNPRLRRGTVRIAFTRIERIHDKRLRTPYTLMNRMHRRPREHRLAVYPATVT
jgi:hypothetical protein